MTQVLGFHENTARTLNKMLETREEKFRILNKDVWEMLREASKLRMSRWDYPAPLSSEDKLLEKQIIALNLAVEQKQTKIKTLVKEINLTNEWHDFATQGIIDGFKCSLDVCEAVAVVWCDGS